MLESVRHALRMFRYSRFLLKSVFNTFIRPPLLVFLISRTQILALPSNYALSGLVYVLSIPFSEIVLTVLSSRRKSRDRKRLGALPVPKVRGRRLGNIDVLSALIAAENSEYPGDIFLQWAKEYGPTFDMNILWASQIVTVDPENVRYVLSTAFTSFEKSEKLRDMFESFWGNGIFTTDGETWKRHRANARPFFAQERLADFTPFEKHMNKMLDILDKLTTDGEPCDIQGLFARYTLDTATEFLFGVSTECLDGFLEHDPDAPYERFMGAFNELAALGATRIRIGSTWPLFELSGDKAVKPTRIIDAFVEPIIRNALRQVRDSDAMDSNFLEHLARVTKDSKMVRDESLNILFAARDTTSSLLTSVAYLLMENPDVEKKMRQEVLDICGPDRTPSIADIRKMKYIEAVLDETLRLFPPVPYNIRRSIDSSALPSPMSKLGQPLYMPPRSSITYAPILIHRDPAFWGEDAHEFRPERWQRGSAPMSHANACMPFNMGPRICLGQQLAYIQATYVWARLLQRHARFERAKDAQPPESLPPTKEWISQGRTGRHAFETIWPHATVVLSVKGGLWVRSVPFLFHEH
ncbi:hypothetical protein PIIN_05462 [Serendipita indica DSM 11827]|uniref:Cytochrome P450 n=1 Tax=Serendipita indica (strain DSM 11827) TaxID=1109443 RepID=G4TJP1_SERID|nr:hypothetical protein PIIN_05462 [Serendipita indica DSM 11827]